MSLPPDGHGEEGNAVQVAGASGSLDAGQKRIALPVLNQPTNRPISDSQNPDIFHSAAQDLPLEFDRRFGPQKMDLATFSGRNRGTDPVVMGASQSAGGDNLPLVLKSRGNDESTSGVGESLERDNEKRTGVQTTDITSNSSLLAATITNKPSVVDYSSSSSDDDHG